MKKFILTVGPALLHEVPLKEIHSDKNQRGSWFHCGY